MPIAIYERKMHIHAKISYKVVIFCYYIGENCIFIQKYLTKDSESLWKSKEIFI